MVSIWCDSVAVSLFLVGVGYLDVTERNELESILNSDLNSSDLFLRFRLCPQTYWVFVEKVDLEYFCGLQLRIQKYVNHLTFLEFAVSLVFTHILAFGFDFCNTVSDRNPLVAGPLRRTDCSLVSDGAAAVVLADTETALKLGKAVVFRAAEHVTDYLPVSKREFLDLEGPARAWQRALANAGVNLLDLDVVESHDCFTTAELMEYEAMGLTPKGRLASKTQEGGKYAKLLSGP